VQKIFIGEIYMEEIGVIVVVVVVALVIREQFVKTKRTMHNSWRSIKEVRPLEDIKVEEDAKRMINGITGTPEKKSGGGFLKTIVWIAIIGVIFYFLFK
jgi:hypothetical protein